MSWKKEGSLRECCNSCIKNSVSCPVEECKNWIDYEEDLNCALIAVKKNGSMTLREVSDRLGLSFVRIKQIQDKAVEKIMKLSLNPQTPLSDYSDSEKNKIKFLEE